MGPTGPSAPLAPADCVEKIVRGILYLKEMTRLHIPAIPHTITSQLYSHCAFTGKAIRFASMMRSRGYQVDHYGDEASEPGADVSIDVPTKQEWQQLRIESDR